ncbi:hypothetical protein GCM10009651_36340 [Microbacterium natoriense]|uniref:hypothetical protein n=1 Tax=Microbacterium natoriense TaxID=284570 RepID=UPI0031E3A6E6
MTDLKALIEKQRAELEVVKFKTVDVVCGGEKVTLTVEKVIPDVWDALMISSPARRGSESDSIVGYNTKAVSLAYPRLLRDGELLDSQTRADLYAVLDSTWRNAIGVVIWGVNVNEPLQEMRTLGKASAGRK